MEFQQSRTYANLQTAFDWELNSSTRYEIYGDQARQEQFIEIANLFDTISRNAKEHARIWFRNINSGILPNTEENLLAASQLEYHAGTEMYREFANIALEEGYNDIAALFNGVANIEMNHDLSFSQKYQDVVRGEVFCKPEETLWICMACGNILSGNCAPEICPVCGFPQGYYRLYTPTN